MIVMGAIAIPYWVILFTIGVLGLFGSGYLIGNDMGRIRGPEIVAIYLGSVIALLSTAILLFVVLQM